MLFDHRTYECRPGAIRAHLDLYKELGYEAQTRHLGKPFLYAQTETGNPNSYIHVWVYKDAADRAARRAAMAADPDWQAYLKKSAEAGYLIRQENRILVAVDFFEGK